MKKLGWVLSAGVITLATAIGCSNKEVDNGQARVDDQNGTTHYDTLDSTANEDRDSVNDSGMGATSDEAGATANGTTGGMGSMSTGTSTSTDTGADIDSNTNDAMGGTSDTGGTSSSGTNESMPTDPGSTRGSGSTNGTGSATGTGAGGM